MGTHFLELTKGAKRERVFIPNERDICDCHPEGFFKAFDPCEGCPYANPAIRRIFPGDSKETARNERLARENPQF